MKEKTKEKQKGKSFWKREGVQGYLFMIPTLIGFPLLCAYPMLYSLYCAFCDWDYILTLDPVFPKSVAVTFIYALINVPVS